MRAMRLCLLWLLLLGCEVRSEAPRRESALPTAPETPLPPRSFPALASAPALPPEPPKTECQKLFAMTDALCVDTSIALELRGTLCSSMQQSLTPLKSSAELPQMEAACVQIREALEASLIPLRAASLPARALP